MTPPSEPPDERPTWARTREVSYAAATPGHKEVVPLPDLVGRSLARDVVATYDLPHYVSSAMDGWAVCGAQPWTVVDFDILHPGECRVIVTGGPVPTGTSAVLRSEHATRTKDGSISRITTSADARGDEPRDGEHIRPVGTEAREGETLIAQGTRLNPAHVALAASVGHDDLPVFARPRVRVVVTGDEVVAAGVPPVGRVRDSFGPTLPSLISSLGGVVVSLLHASDSEHALLAALSDAPDDHDLIITTGGTGRSSADHLHAATAALGARLIVDGIRMRPGGPSILARFPDGRFLVGLPGNPLAAVLGLITLAGPLLAALTGAPCPRTDLVPVSADIPGRPDVSVLIPYRLQNGMAVPTIWVGSGMIRGLAASAAVLVCPPSGISRGADAQSFSLPWVTA